MKSQEKRVVKHPDKWRETIDPFSLAYKSFHPIEILGYPHAGNDVFHARGIYKGKEVRAYIKAARQKGTAIENEVAILSQLHSPIYPTVLDCGFAGTPFSVTLELPGERLSTIVGENETLESLEFPGFLGILKSRSALGELRSATGGLETVLNQYYCIFPSAFKAFRRLTSRFPL